MENQSIKNTIINGIKRKAGGLVSLGALLGGTCLLIGTATMAVPAAVHVVLGLITGGSFMAVVNRMRTPSVVPAPSQC